MTAFGCFRKQIQMLLADGKTSIRAIHEGTGISKGSLGEYLKGQHVPSLDNADKIAGFFGLRLADILSEQDPPTLNITRTREPSHDEIADFVMRRLGVGETKREIIKFCLSASDQDAVHLLDNCIAELKRNASKGAS